MATPTDIAVILRRYFPERAIPGILANIDVETGGTFDYKQQQKGGNGYGLFQFDFQKDAYHKWLEDTKEDDSADSQIQFVAESIYNDKSIPTGLFKTEVGPTARYSQFSRTGEEEDRIQVYTGPLDLGGAAREALRNSFETGTHKEIARSFSDYFERPGTPHIDRREKSAVRIAGLLSGE